MSFSTEKKKITQRCRNLQNNCPCSALWSFKYNWILILADLVDLKARIVRSWFWAFLHFSTLLFTWHAAFIHWLCGNHWRDLCTICSKRKGILQQAARVLIKYYLSCLSQAAEEIALALRYQWTYVRWC